MAEEVFSTMRLRMMEDEIKFLKMQQSSLKSKVDEGDFKKSTESVEIYSEKMNDILMQQKALEERVNEKLNALLCFTLLLSFGNNFFFNIIVQFNSSCGSWVRVFGLMAAYLALLGFPLWFNWGILQSNLDTIEFLLINVENLGSKILNAQASNPGSGSGVAGLPKCPNIKDIRGKFVKKFIGISVFVVIQCIGISVGSHILLCGNSLSFGPLLLSALTRFDIA